MRNPWCLHKKKCFHWWLNNILCLESQINLKLKYYGNYYRTIETIAIGLYTYLFYFHTTEPLYISMKWSSFPNVSIIIRQMPLLVWSIDLLLFPWPSTVGYQYHASFIVIIYLRTPIFTLLSVDGETPKPFNREMWIVDCRTRRLCRGSHNRSPPPELYQQLLLLINNYRFSIFVKL